MVQPEIPRSEYARRRRRLLRLLRGAAGLVLAGKAAGDAFQAHAHFRYLAGVEGEAEAALLLDPTHPVPMRREILFLRALDPEADRWDGYRETIAEPLRAATGFKSIFRLGHLGRFLLDAARRARTVACLHPLASHEQPVSADLAIFRKLQERVPGLTIADRSDLVPALRAVKSGAEIGVMERAARITAAGFAAVLRELRPGMNEFDVQTLIEHAYRSHGARGPAFPTIVGAGRNATVLHYRANDRAIEAGDLVCLDSGAAFGGYGADVTRTLPASGRFTPRQREVYDVVLAAQEAAIAALRPGARLTDADRVARAVITKAGLGDAFIHGIGHHLGLETHDADPNQPLRERAVVTVEPGVYLPAEAIGIRIEDDVVVSRDGARVLTSAIPKSVAAIEAAMQGRA
jgi:Xaa-Pro aminopeptidase